VPHLGEQKGSGVEVLKDEAEQDVLHVEGQHRLEQAQGHCAHLPIRQQIILGLRDIPGYLRTHTYILEKVRPPQQICIAEVMSGVKI
jgi:hypothetical protein